jgi:hypothetical protein
VEKVFLPEILKRLLGFNSERLSNSLLITGRVSLILYQIDIKQLKKTKRMKNIYLLLIILIFTPGLNAQQIYCDFEGLKMIYFGEASGKLDSIFSNPKHDFTDSSANCLRYIRNSDMYDNFKIYTNSRMMDVDDFANSSPSASKIKIKIYSTAPVGTPIHLQLGSSINNNYPGGIHSEYIAYTSERNTWQNLTFNYYQSPRGGLTTANNLDKMVILLHPGVTDMDTVYMDDISGPPLMPLNIPAPEKNAPFKLFQNSPNPAKETTYIGFILNTQGEVSLHLFDMVGNPIVTLLKEQKMKAGSYSIPVNTEYIPNGVYFYVLKKDGVSRSMKLIVSK